MRNCLPAAVPAVKSNHSSIKGEDGASDVFDESCGISGYEGADSSAASSIRGKQQQQNQKQTTPALSLLPLRSSPPAGEVLASQPSLRAMGQCPRRLEEALTESEEFNLEGHPTAKVSPAGSWGRLPADPRLDPDPLTTAAVAVHNWEDLDPVETCNAPGHQQLSAPLENKSGTNIKDGGSHLSKEGVKDAGQAASAPGTVEPVRGVVHDSLSSASIGVVSPCSSTTAVVHFLVKGPTLSPTISTDPNSDGGLIHPGEYSNFAEGIN